MKNWYFFSAFIYNQLSIITISHYNFNVSAAKAAYTLQFKDYAQNIKEILEIRSYINKDKTDLIWVGFYNSKYITEEHVEYFRVRMLFETHKAVQPKIGPCNLYHD